MQKKYNIIHVCEFLGMLSLRIGLSLVLEGVVFHYIWLKYLFETVTVYSDVFYFEHFCLKIQNWVSKKKIKKGQPLFSNILGWSEKGKQTFFFLGLITSLYRTDSVGSYAVRTNETVYPLATSQQKQFYCLWY